MSDSPLTSDSSSKETTPSIPSDCLPTEDSDDSPLPKTKLPWRRVGKDLWSQNPDAPAYRTAHRDRATAAKVRARNRERLAAARAPRDFWSVVKGWISPARVPCPVPVDDLKECFERRMQSTSVPPHLREGPNRVFINSMANQIPDRTAPSDDTHTCLTDEITEEDVDRGKAKIRTKGGGKSKGEDGIAYKVLLTVPSDVLAVLFQTCISRQDIPHSWLRSILVTILKKGRDKYVPESYRIIALESCFLTLLTTILDFRLRQWADDIGLLPPSQNGFRPGLRTENNVFLLRAAIEQCKATDKPLFTAFLDLSNAFPTVDRPLLWVKLYNRGARGPIFDWIRLLYRRMSYAVRSEGTTSQWFPSDIGILAGDPASPFAFLAYISDFDLPPDPDDVILSGARVSHTEQADDMALLSMSLAGLDSKVSRAVRWAAANFMEINPAKSYLMLFNPGRARQKGDVFIDGTAIPYTDEVTFLGVKISSNGRADMFGAHYPDAARKAWNAANAVLSCRAHTGLMSPPQLITLYKAHVDPSLTFMAGVMPDVSASSLHPLELVQQHFIRRALGLGCNALTVLLFTETGLWPLRFRRAHLLLRYLSYVLGLPEDSWVRHAASSSSDLASLGVKSWYLSVSSALAKVGCPSPSLPPLDALTPDLLSDLESKLKISVARWCSAQVESSVKTYLLPSRLVSTPGGVPHPATLALRHYLTIEDQAHRRALTRIIFSNHSFALETMRYSRPRVPRAERLCRVCSLDVESPEHALLVCSGVSPSSGILRLRRSLYDSLVAQDRESDWHAAPAVLLVSLIDNDALRPAVAELAHEAARFWKVKWSRCSRLPIPMHCPPPLSRDHGGRLGHSPYLPTLRSRASDKPSEPPILETLEEYCQRRTCETQRNVASQDCGRADEKVKTPRRESARFTEMKVGLEPVPVGY